MRLPIATAALAGVCVISAGFALAQHSHPPSHNATKTEAADARELVHIPPQLTLHMLANMRDHLLALEEMQRALSRGEFDKAGKIAEQRLGLSSLGLHGAHEVAKFMPQGMRDAGSGMHRAASRFAIVAQDSAVTGDLKPALAAMAEIMSQCVGCHAGYRVK